MPEAYFLKIHPFDIYPGGCQLKAQAENFQLSLLKKSGLIII